MLANTPHAINVMPEPVVDEFDCGMIDILVHEHTARFIVVGDREEHANAFEISCEWTDKCGYKLKVKPTHSLRRRAKHLARAVHDYTWTSHEPNSDIQQDHKLYNSVRKDLLEFMLRSLVTDRVQQFFKESSNGI